MAAAAEKVYDIYAAILNFKDEIAVLKRPALTISWIPEDHLRRLKAYEILAAFYFNYSRDYRMAPESGDTGNNDNVSEFGDAAWLCNRFKAKLLGDQIKLSITGPKSLKKITTLKAQLARTETAVPDASGDIQENVNTPSINAPSDAPTAVSIQVELNTLTVLQDLVRQREEFMQDWFEEENILEAIDENELLASYLGDCVYMVEWEDGKPNIVTYDPGFFFPFYNINSNSLQEEVPEFVNDRVYICWEERADSAGKQIEGDRIRIWRDCYELRKMNDDGSIKKCFRHYGYFDIAAGQSGLTLQAFDIKDMIIDQGTSSYEVQGNTDGWLDLGIDFIPFVLIPNIKVQGHDFGISNLHHVIGLIDAVINNDTDVQANAEKLGGAVAVLSGEASSFPKDAAGNPIPISIRPNTVYGVGKDGGLALLDTSRMQTALIETGKKLLDKLVKNTDLTTVGAGMVGEGVGGVLQSGVALTIMMQPLIEKIAPMRAVRRIRYTRLFYMVQKFWQLFGIPEEKQLFAEPLYNAYLNFGAVIPTDKTQKLDYYIKLGTLVDRESLMELMKEDGLINLDIQTVLERLDKQEKTAAENQAATFGGATSFGGTVE